MHSFVNTISLPKFCVCGPQRIGMWKGFYLMSKDNGISVYINTVASIGFLLAYRGGFRELVAPFSNAGKQR